MGLAAHVGGMAGRHGKAARLGAAAHQGTRGARWVIDACRDGVGALTGGVIVLEGRRRRGYSTNRGGAIQHIVRTNLVGFPMGNGSAVGLSNFFEAN